MREKHLKSRIGLGGCIDRSIGDDFTPPDVDVPVDECRGGREDAATRPRTTKRIAIKVKYPYWRIRQKIVRMECRLLRDDDLFNPLSDSKPNFSSRLLLSIDTSSPLVV